MKIILLLFLSISFLAGCSEASEEKLVDNLFIVSVNEGITLNETRKIASTFNARIEVTNSEIRYNFIIHTHKLGYKEREDMVEKIKNHPSISYVHGSQGNIQLQ